MLYADIKTYLIEIESGEDELYLQDLEDCSNMDQLVQVFADYYGTDEFEGARLLLTKITQ